MSDDRIDGFRQELIRFSGKKIKIKNKKEEEEDKFLLISFSSQF